MRALRVELRSPLPSSLQSLLDGLRAVRSRDVRLYPTTRSACTQGEHERVPWRTGVYAGLELRLDVCPWCAGVEVRDVSLDMRPGLKAGPKGPARRSSVLGWYSGRRVARRTYM